MSTLCLRALALAAALSAAVGMADDHGTARTVRPGVARDSQGPVGKYVGEVKGGNPAAAGADKPVTRPGEGKSSAPLPPPPTIVGVVWQGDCKRNPAPAPGKPRTSYRMSLRIDEGYLSYTKTSYFTNNCTGTPDQEWTRPIIEGASRVEPRQHPYGVVRVLGYRKTEQVDGRWRWLRPPQDLILSWRISDDGKRLDVFEVTGEFEWNLSREDKP